GLCRFSALHGMLPQARELGEQLCRLAQHEAEPAPRLLASAMLGQVLFFLGEYATARMHLEQGLVLVDVTAPRAPGLLHEVAPEVTCLGATAHTLWSLGYPAQAVLLGQETLSLAQALAHPLSLVVAKYFMSYMHYCRREVSVLQTQAEALSTVAAAQ